MNAIEINLEEDEIIEQEFYFPAMVQVNIHSAYGSRGIEQEDIIKIKVRNITKGHTKEFFNFSDISDISTVLYGEVVNSKINPYYFILELSFELKTSPDPVVYIIKCAGKAANLLKEDETDESGVFSEIHLLDTVQDSKNHSILLEGINESGSTTITVNL